MSSLSFLSSPTRTTTTMIRTPTATMTRTPATTTTTTTTTTTARTPTTLSSPVMRSATTPTSLTLADIDQEFKQVGCLGHGGFGSVFLAQKRSGRRVALKFIYLDEDKEDRLGFFTREVAAVRTLNLEKESRNRDQAIVRFEGAFVGSSGLFACVAMKYYDGGSLADAIVNCTKPFSERRIASYALQLSEALAYAHSKGVVHHDVKSANVLIDRSRGGKLVLVDFGSAVAPGEESVIMTEIYAPPELLRARANDDFSGLENVKIDSFGVGCVLFELICCSKLVDLTGDRTLAEFVEANSVNAAMNLPDVKLPWLEPHTSTSSSSNGQPRQPIVGYSNALRSLISLLIEPNPSKRWSVAQMQAPLRLDPQSPLLANYVAAAHPVVPGAAVTVDNVQLGLFVQRGKDWSDGNADGGGRGSIGVVAKLDADAGYTSVIWLHGDSSLSPMLHRIGENEKYEIQVGPTCIFGSTDNPRWTGLVETTKSYQVGEKITENCVVVAVRPDEKLILVSPVNRSAVSTLPVMLEHHFSVPALLPRKELNPPSTWTNNSDILVEVTDPQEQGDVMNFFYAADGGVDLQQYEIVSMKRVQCLDIWKQYAHQRELVAANNWGSPNPNESRLFWGAHLTSLGTTLVRNSREFVEKCHADADEVVYFFKHSLAVDQRTQARAEGERKMVLAQVALGRMLDSRPNVIAMNCRPPHEVPYHSVRASDTMIRLSPTQAYPEYIITYKITGRRTVTARRPTLFGARPSSPVARLNPFMQQHSALASSSSSLTGRQSGQANSGSVQSAANTTVSLRPQTASTAASNEEDNAKMCVVCLEKPVCRVAVPCGHVSLCQLCSSEQGLHKLRRKCPECRADIREVIRFYGKVVNEG